MDGIDLDEILNGSTTEPEVVEAADVEAPAETQPRDEGGRFAPKQQEEETPEIDPDNAAQSVVEGGERGKVPVAAVQAEREKARLAREEAETLRREMAELRGQVTALTQQRQQPQTPAEKPKPKVFWENPDEYLNERLAPVQETMQSQRIELSTMLAIEKHGETAVSEAQAALAAAMKANPSDPSLIALDQQTRTSIHPMSLVLAWHDRQKAMADIGDDPKAYLERERERIRAELMAELGGETPAPANPSTTTKPLTKLPQSLNRLPGAGNGNGAIDTSDEGIFKTAMGNR